ncbi:hypothetical protein ACHAXR_012718 [Thalassiosira sp. AJA248-18]
MFRLVSALAIVLAGIPSTSAFSASTIRAEIVSRSSTSMLNYHPNPEETHDRALDCVNNFGMCDIDELLYLSEELDEYLGCHVEDGPEECDKEIDERQALSEALLVQGEMMEHNRYIQEGNLLPVSDNTSPQPSVWREEDDLFFGAPPLDP